jgi:prepilin-type N-terminal cleavage/methylation domain-containing protein
MRLPARSAGARVGARTPRPFPRVDRLITRLRQRAGDERGFTIVEVIVATVVIVVGLLTAYLALNVALHSSSDVRQREEGVSLARQITEDARSIPYSQLSNATIVTTLQAYPGLSNSSTGSAWTIVRAGYTYTVTATLTDITDPKDTSGATDIKQFTVTVAWSTYQGTCSGQLCAGNQHQYTETATMSSAGQDPGLQATTLQLASPPWGSAGITGSQTAPVVTATGISYLQFTVNAPAGTQAIVWSLNGVKESTWAGSAPSTGNTWTSADWSLSGVSDGNYTVSAAAEDSNGVDGPAVTMPVRLIRNVPSAPAVTGDGFNTKLPGGPATVAEFQWNPNPELNVVGYRLYYVPPAPASKSLICQTALTTAYSSCTGNGWCISPTACIDLNPPSPTSANLNYQVVALYYDASNNLQEGTATGVTLTSGVPTPPPAPTFGSGQGDAAQLDGTAIITWTPSSGGTPVSFYRIYRDGTTYKNRYDTISAASCLTVCTYHDVNRAEAHSYYITAVGGTTPGADMAESSPVAAPVTAGSG